MVTIKYLQVMYDYRMFILMDYSSTINTQLLLGLMLIMEHLCIHSLQMKDT